MSNAEPLVSVLCATRNAREVVRLTLASFRRHTPEHATVLVADNGSTDGTLEDLRALPWITFFSLEDRQTTSTAHGPALDWLAARVRTRYFLTLDSDVEFLATGWLGDMLELAEARDLTALGVYEPGVGGFRERLAPFAMLVRTAEFAKLDVSFQPFIRIEDPVEAERWLARSRGLGPGYNLDAEEAASYRTAAFYPTGGAVFERLQETRARWADLPAAIACKLRHLGHMSWAATDGTSTQKTDHAARLRYVRERVATLAPPGIDI